MEGVQCEAGDMALVVGPLHSDDGEVLSLLNTFVKVVRRADAATCKASALAHTAWGHSWVVESSLMREHWIVMADSVLRPVRALNVVSILRGREAQR